ncbi:polyhydroxyalkanoic acid system family protein [Oceaniglobus roseus]|uniref:polyhydroxyalkanoic acid system family protein n=1 Tax=Oceaniglobus roseus TaxID=1737570 RepID=UPI000C7EF58B|nr:polyhydroxyalkanoic acid system family protein [Kandeliimicrobium roseum]
MAGVNFHVPHDLDVEEAAARLLAGLPKLERSIPGGGQVAAERVGADGMHLTIGVMGQKIVVRSVLTEEAVSGTVEVPMMLSMMRMQIAEEVERSVGRMLAKPVA